MSRHHDYPGKRRHPRHGQQDPAARRAPLHTLSARHPCIHTRNPICHREGKAKKQTQEVRAENRQNGVRVHPDRPHQAQDEHQTRKKQEPPRAWLSENENGRCHDKTIQREPAKARLLHDGYHHFAGEQPRQECRQEAQAQRNSTDS